MPALNKIARSIHDFIRDKVVDIPDIPRDKKREIAKAVAEFAKEIIVESISESVAKTASGKLNK
jgi:DNA-directed RNA polymerase specialized sigma subunit